MHSPVLLLLGSTLLLPFATAATSHPPQRLLPGSPRRRDATSACEQLYGAGSVACAGTGASNGNGTMCYNPSQGQTCCADGGYCEAGQSCAPVAGYCCDEGEDLATCARNAGFTLPSSASSSFSLAASTSVSFSASPSESESGAGPAASATTSSLIPDTPITTSEVSFASATPAPPSPSSPTAAPVPPSPQANSSAPAVQVSAVAGKGKEQWTLVWMASGIAAVGLIMATF